VTFTIESLGSPVTAAGRNTLPGIVAKSVLDVITTATTVANRLLLYVSAEMTNTGRRLAGREPEGAQDPPSRYHPAQSPVARSVSQDPTPHGNGIR